MRSHWKDAATAVLMAIILPVILLNFGSWLYAGQTVQPQETETQPQAAQSSEPVYISVLFSDGVVTMELEEYLVGVVLGEMPASFSIEALKAQAVVARTYTLRCRDLGRKHAAADICADPGCCQAYTDPQGAGTVPKDVKKIREAVEATAGMVLTYDGELIEATYFSSSGGWTEDAVAVWGSDLPYLQATPSPETGYEDQYLRTVSMTPGAFAAALGRDLKGEAESWFGAVTYTEGGGVETMVIGGISYRGTELRTLLGLRSTAFTVGVYDGMIHITTLGFGHRVGMSQYGAEAMAVEGNTYSQILAHYYQGTVLEEFIDNGSDFG